MKTLDVVSVALATETRASVRNGKLFIITDIELPTANGTICTAFLIKSSLCLLFLSTVVLPSLLMTNS